MVSSHINIVSFMIVIKIKYKFYENDIHGKKNEI